MAAYDTDAIRRWRTALRPTRRPPPPDPALSALLVVDAQEYFAGMCAPILDAVRRAVEASRSIGVPVLFTQHGHADGRIDGGMLAEWWQDLVMEGTPEHGLLPETGVRPGDRIIPKRRYDAFFGTDLEGILRGLGAQDLAVAGVMTNLCVETTVRTAFVRDFRVRVLMDATASATEEMHLAALASMAYGFAYVQTVDEWVAGLSGRSRRVREP